MVLHNSQILPIIYTSSSGVLVLHSSQVLAMSTPAVETPGRGCNICNDFFFFKQPAMVRCILSCGAACHVVCGQLGNIQGFVCSDCSIHLAVDDGYMARPS